MFITILTPTYNRAYRLTNLYNSLVNQKNNNFEWLIIDDGSTDDTESTCRNWKRKKFNIEYFYKENGGKHTAINYGLKFARGDYIFIVDSDDYLLPEAIGKVLNWIQQIDCKDDYAGVSGLRGYTQNKAIGERPKLDIDYVDCTNLQRQKFHLRGDKAEIYKTSILKKYAFPEFIEEKYLPEDVVWNAIARDGYKLRWFNEIIYIGEYLDDGLTKSKDLRVFNFEGYTYRERMNVKLLNGFEKYMSLGRYIDLLYQKQGNIKNLKILLDISSSDIIVSYIIYILRKYGKKILNME